MRQANDNDPKPKGKCPICGRPTVVQHRPFCSPRCKDVDLGRWLTGGYVIQTNEEPEEDEFSPSRENDET